MSRKTLLFYAIASSLLGFAARSQNTTEDKISISGNLTFEKTISANAIFIYLIESDSKKLIKTETPLETNDFKFENVSKGTYFIKIVADGKTKHLGNPFEAKSNLILQSIIIRADENLLDEVVITKSKPYIERQQGKMILNVDSNIGSTGSSVFEVLEKAPGINVDNNDNISLRGKNGILVQIDGKPTPMTGSNLANYLRGIPSRSIDKIEFITNPSAKYDAAGASIINIKMKKDKKIGVNGSISSSYSQGKYAKNNNNLSLNYRDKKVNLFGNYSFAYREGFNDLQLDRKFYEDGIFTGAYEQDNFLRMNFRNHLARVGADFYANKKHTFGIIVNNISNKFNPTGSNRSDVFDETDNLASRFQTKNRSRDHWHNHSVNLNHKFVIDTLGTELTTDFDYANYGNKTQQNFTTRYFNLNNSEFQDPYLLYGDIKGDLKIYALKSDYVTVLKNNIKLETGVKSSYVKADNNLAFYDKSSGVPVFDPTKSNHFIHEENINAAYVITSKEFKKWSFNIGLRVENTNITGKQLVDNTSFKNSYTQLFPNAVFSYTLNEKNSLELNYSRRISRPSYDQLNPFKFFLDPTTYKEGNPYLLPQSTHSIELTHVLKQKIFTTLNFSRTTDNITEVIAPSEDDQQLTIQTNKNLNTVDIVGLFAIVPLEINKWWNVNNSLNFYYGYYTGTVANTTIKNEGNFTCNFNSTNSFKLGNGFTAEWTGNYRAREVYAFMDVDPIWFMNIGCQKKFKNNSVLRFAFNDIFYTNRTTASTAFTDYKENFKVARDTRVATISYTYNFGKNNGPQRRRTGGADDIKQRAGSSNG
ncbi:outer membrane beta-barrel family protein [Flavobacterium sp. 102]|uniref:outer membrane beta-barrel family protein n=1 Tax=Flavobacterium sp. 102 TaxID=2135623 RepID=UPI000EB136C9|nr:outer membrane beta-barrel family protein [Flavobacterium sp. 102]RKS01034.1 outer membrane receptor protein involved in Fe transport [Flavobacterium sp. 102]